MANEPFMATRAQRAFIITITIQAIVVIAMVGMVFRRVDLAVNVHDNRYKTLPCYLALFALAEIFEFIMAVDALRSRNIVQLIGILLFHLALVAFAALQVRQTKTALVTQEHCDAAVSYVFCDGHGTLWRRVEPYLIVVPCVLAVAWFTMLFWIKQLYAEFGWAIFHVVGANPKMRTMYQWYEIMICLLKFDFFCFGGVTMQLLILVLSRNSTEFGVTITAIPIVLVLLAGCGLAVQREIKWLMVISLALMLPAMSYFLYKLIRFYQPSSQEQYLSTRGTLTFFTIVAFTLLFATFAVGLRCFSDFDQGLLQSKVDDDPQKKKYTPDIAADMNQTSYHGGSTLAPRISIE